MTCPDDDLLVRLAHGGLSEVELEGVDAHLDECSDCRRLVAAVAGGSAATDPRPAAPVLRAGDTLGRYVVESLIGAGGMGVLYAAHDTRLGRRVAVKLMRPHLAGEAGRARLLREAQAMAQLSHPNVVNVFDLGEVDERVFVAMELVEGGTLRHWLSTPRTVEAICAVFLQAGAGLLAAHRAGLVHRDFKPDNVLIGADGRVRVTDFGLARPGGEELTERLAPESPVTLTRTGTVLGTPAYMAPEQLELRPADARSDQYAFCVSLYEALVGARPFEGGTLAEVRAQVLSGVVRRPPPDRVPDRVWPVLKRGLSVDPAARFSSLEGVLAALEAAPPEPGVGGLAAGALVVLTALGLVAWALATAAPAPPAPATPVAAEPQKPVPETTPARTRPEEKVTPPTTREEELDEEALPEPLPPDGTELAVEPKASRGFDVSQATRVVIADPVVADVAVDGTILTLHGVAPGRTALTVTRAGKSHTWPVRVRTAVELPPQAHSLFVGALRLVAVSGLTRIAVGDASVVDVETVGHDALLLAGHTAGRTNVLVWTRDARRLELVVTVSGDDTPPPADEPELILTRGLQRVMRFPGLERFSLGARGVCDATRLGDDELLLLPRAPGRTSLMVWTGDGKRQARTLVVHAAPE